MRQDEKLYCFVSPHFVPAGKILAAAGGVGNAVAVVGDMVGEVTFCGPGAGRYPTASAVVADIIDIARHPGREQPGGLGRSGREAGLLSRLLRALVCADEGSKGGRGGEARCGRVAPGAGRLPRRRDRRAAPAGTEGQRPRAERIVADPGLKTQC